MVKEGFPFVIVPAIIALIFGFLQIWLAAAFFIAVALFMAYFFRDPVRSIPDEDDVVGSDCGSVCGCVGRPGARGLA